MLKENNDFIFHQATYLCLAGRLRAEIPVQGETNLLLRSRDTFHHSSSNVERCNSPQRSRFIKVISFHDSIKVGIPRTPPQPGWFYIFCNLLDAEARLSFYFAFFWRYFFRELFRGQKFSSLELLAGHVEASPKDDAMVIEGDILQCNQRTEVLYYSLQKMTLAIPFDPIS